MPFLVKSHRKASAQKERWSELARLEQLVSEVPLQS